MNADGSGQTPLTTVSGSIQDGGPSFSPDGQRIAWSRFTGPPPNQDIYIMNADGSGQTQVTSGPGQDYAPEFSPDGTRIVFERESQNFQYSDILLADPNGLDLGITPLTANQAPDYDSNPAWQPLNPPNCTIDRQRDPEVDQVDRAHSRVPERERAPSSPRARARRRSRSRARSASKAKRFTIPPVSGQAPEGTQTTLTLAIPKKGKKALKKAAKAGKKGKATISATFTDDLGQSSTDLVTVKFKPKKK